MSNIDIIKSRVLIDQTGRIKFVINNTPMNVTLSKELINDLHGAFPLDGWEELELILAREFRCDVDNKQSHVNASTHSKYFVECLKFNWYNQGT